MNKAILATAAIFTLLISSSCMFFGMDFVDSKLKVNNRSEKKIGILLNLMYPDTSISNTYHFPINAKEKGSIHLLNRKWDYYFKKKHKVKIFVVDWEDLTQHNYKSREKYKILNHYLFSESDLDSLDWIIEYP